MILPVPAQVAVLIIVQFRASYADEQHVCCYRQSPAAAIMVLFIYHSRQMPLHYTNCLYQLKFLHDYGRRFLSGFRLRSYKIMRGQFIRHIRQPNLFPAGTDCTSPGTSGAFYKSSSSAGSGYVTCNKYITCTPPTDRLYCKQLCSRSFLQDIQPPEYDTMRNVPQHAQRHRPCIPIHQVIAQIGPFYTSSTTGYTTVCQACNTSCTSYNGSSETNSIVYGDTACAGPFYSSSGTGHTTNCSKIQIAKRSIFQLMDNNGGGTVDVNGCDQSGCAFRFHDLL